MTVRRRKGGLMNGSNTIERAYQLARSGECATLADLRRRLSAEGCLQVTQHLCGRSIQQSLRRLLEKPVP
jgi:hypothetical protein